MPCPAILAKGIFVLKILLVKIFPLNPFASYDSAGIFPAQSTPMQAIFFNQAISMTLTCCAFLKEQIFKIPKSEKKPFSYCSSVNIILFILQTL